MKKKKCWICQSRERVSAPCRGNEVLRTRSEAVEPPVEQGDGS